MSERDRKIQEERQLVARAQASEKAEKQRKDLEKNQHNREMTQALNNIEHQKNDQWRQKVSDHSNQQASLELQAEMNRLRSE